MSVFYLLRLKCIEDEYEDCEGCGDPCLQVLWFRDMTYNNRTCPWDKYSDERIAIFLGELPTHAIEIASAIDKYGEWNRVRAELIEVKGCYDSFKAGMELAESEAEIPGGKYRPVVSSVLLPKNFAPAVPKTQEEPLCFDTAEEFMDFFAQRVKEKEGNGDPGTNKKIKSV